MIEQLDLAICEFISQNFGGITEWIGGMSCEQVLTLAIGLACGLPIAWNLFAHWWNSLPDPSEAYDAEWMDYGRWESTR